MPIGDSCPIFLKVAGLKVPAIEEQDLIIYICKKENLQVTCIG